jgi:tetrahydromethanopterin S-methyltransferase subunit F
MREPFLLSGGQVAVLGTTEAVGMATIKALMGRHAGRADIQALARDAAKISGLKAGGVQVGMVVAMMMMMMMMMMMV